MKPNFELEVNASINGLGTIESNMEQVLSQALDIKKYYEKLVINEDMLTDIKNEKASINKAIKVVSDYRKSIVNEFNKPLEVFVNKAKETESALKSAYETCNSQVNKYEDITRKAKEEELRKYFEEAKEAYGIKFLEFEQANVNVTLSASMKSLKTKILDFIKSVKDDIEFISNEEYADEILIEYQKTLNIKNSILIVKDRVSKLEALKKTQIIEKPKEEIEEVKEEPKVIEPVEVKEEPTYEMTFKVYGTLKQLKGLKKYLESEGIKYE